MADDDPDRQRLEDMLKASEQRRPAGGSSGEGGSGQGSDESRRESREEPPGDQGAAGHGERPARATGTAKTMVTAGLITGGLSIPGALLPIIGVLLGIAAIVLGVMVSRRAADARAKIAMGLGAVGLVLSIVLGIIGIFSLQDENGNGGGDSEDGGGDSEDGGGDSEDSGGEDDSSSVLPPYVVAVTLEGRPV
jgi:hypothetical protein